MEQEAGCTNNYNGSSNQCYIKKCGIFERSDKIHDNLSINRVNAGKQSE